MSRRPRTRKPIATHKPLDARQLRFVDEYLVDLCGAAAARRAGYSAKDSRKRAQILLDRDDVQARLREKMQARAERVQITADRVLQELAHVGFSSIAHYVIDGATLALAEAAPADAIRAVASVKGKTRIEHRDDGGDITTHELEYRLWPKVEALTKIGDHLGMWKQIVETRNRTLEDMLKELAPSADDGTDPAEPSDAGR